MRTRVIPVLLLSAGGLVKTVRFREPAYIGDPINAVRIFNDKEVDELALLDIDATAHARGPGLAMIREIVEEAFIPLAYGGGVRHTEDAAALLNLGVEKVVVNSAFHDQPGLVHELATRFGSQSVVVSIDYARTWLGRSTVRSHGGRRNRALSPVAAARAACEAGAGEIMLTCIDREGTRRGYDLETLAQVSASVHVPVIAHGGAGGIEDLQLAVRSGASAVAAGSLFCQHGRHRGVLISYPERSLLESHLP